MDFRSQTPQSGHQSGLIRELSRLTYAGTLNDELIWNDFMKRLIHIVSVYKLQQASVSFVLQDCVGLFLVVSEVWKVDSIQVFDFLSISAAKKSFSLRTNATLAEIFHNLFLSCSLECFSSMFRRDYQVLGSIGMPWLTLRVLGRFRTVHYMKFIYNEPGYTDCLIVWLLYGAST